MASVQSANVDWQSTKNTILERNRHMFNNSDMSDISFTCEGSDKTFYAHKYVLSTSSAVFHAMFYGGLAVKDSIVHLSDTNEKRFGAVFEISLHGGMYIDRRQCSCNHVFGKEIHNSFAQ
jgi:hypothetical protein